MPIPRPFPPFLLATLLTLTSCGSDEIVNPEETGDAIVRLTSPGPEVAGALLELTGVADLLISDGTVVLGRVGDRLRVIVVLDEPGLLDFGVRFDQSVTSPVGELLEVIGPDNRMVESLTGYVLEFVR